MRQIFVGCCKCKTVVGAISARRDIHRQLTELTVSCHGAVETMVLSDVDMQTCNTLLVFAECRRVNVKT